MKKLLLPMLAICVAFSACGQHGTDLEKLTFNEDAGAMSKGHDRHADPNEIVTTLPEYEIYDVKDFHFGPVDLVKGCTIEFLVNSIAEKNFSGINIRFQTDETAKAVNEYIFKNYPKPTKVLQKETKQLDHNNKPYLSPSAFLWMDIKPGISMILSTDHEEENGKPLQTTSVLIIKDDVKTAVPTEYGTGLKRAIATYTQNN